MSEPTSGLSEEGHGARGRILARLRAAPRTDIPANVPPAEGPSLFFQGEDLLAQFTRMLEISHAEVHEVDGATWPERLRVILANKGVRRLMYAPAIAAGQALADAWSASEAPTPILVAYDRPVEECREVLVGGVDAALTTTLGGIAETGSLVLWPDQNEPRLMSLLPPIHVALVEKGRITATLGQMVREQGWAERMPTNALLISGPSGPASISFR